MKHSVRVEYWDVQSNAWTLRHILDAANAPAAEMVGLVEARALWRQGVAGIRVTVISPVVVLERMR